MSLKDDAIEYHSSGRRGKIEVIPTKPLLTQRDLSLAYTPGVAEPCLRIARDPDLAYDYTARGNLVAVVTNGTAVLGLGNIGPLASKPVMEGKANLFKKFADIDVFDIELDAPTADEVIAAVKAIAPTVGGINLEDIKAPDCFRIERELQAALDIPVFHDDQHGTAIISAAALINAAEVSGRRFEDLKLVVSGAGAAAVSCAELMISLGVRREHVFMHDSKGLITTDRAVGMSPEKAAFAQPGATCSVGESLIGADVFLGLSVGGLLTGEMVKAMAPKPIIFAMANPDPEIGYPEAKAARPDAIVATGRSDFPNQVNNVLCFPYIFRGALDCRARKVTEEMKVAAVRALAALAREDVPDVVLQAYNLERLSFGPEYLIPKPFDPRVLLWVAPAVAQAAADCGVARKPIGDMDAYRQRLELVLERSREVLRPLLNRARKSPRRIVFPDGTHPKVLRAAQILVDEGICHPVLIGPEWKIVARAEQHNVNLRGMEIVEIADNPIFDGFADRLWTTRRRKGLTMQSIRQWLRYPVVYGCMMVKEGQVDGLVGGLAEPYAHTIRPSLKIIGTDPEHPVISGTYVMLLKERRFFFGDCTVNSSPDAEMLARIAINTAQVAVTFGEKPKVAMISFSDFGAHRSDPQVRTVRRALTIVRERWPGLLVDGEMQADTAVNPVLAQAHFPFSEIAGQANVLVFPDITSGNVAYKLLRELGGATAIGPVLVGLNHPVNVLALGSTVADIVNMAGITANQALDKLRLEGQEAE